MTREEFLDRIDDIMCGISNAERACLEDLYDEVTKPHWMPLPQAPHHFADVSQKVKKGGEE